MRTRRFKQVDVFTEVPFLGNPVAVVFDADDLSTNQMQAIARWTNLSETTFVLSPTMKAADYLLRIFTPNAELPFAGHPTLGSLHAAREVGQVDRSRTELVQQCGAGLVRLSVEQGRNRQWLTLPTPKLEPLGASHRALLDQALQAATGSGGAPAYLIDVGPVWLTVQLDSAAAVLALRPDQSAIAALSRDLGLTGVTIFGDDPESPGGVEVRAFAPAHGVDEDPVCGSGNGCVAAYRRLLGHRMDYAARQGRAIGRNGTIAVRYRGDAIEIGGAAVTCVDGTMLA